MSGSDIASDPWHAQLTLRLALTHRTGFANWRRMTGSVLQFTRPPGTAFGLLRRGLRVRGAVRLMHTGQDDLFTFTYLDLTSRSGTVIFTNSAHGGNLVLPILEQIGADSAFVAFLRSQS